MDTKFSSVMKILILSTRTQFFVGEEGCIVIVHMDKRLYTGD